MSPTVAFTTLMNGPNKLLCAIVFHITRLERLVKDKQSILLGPFLSFKDDEGLSTLAPAVTLIFFAT